MNPDREARLDSRFQWIRLRSEKLQLQLKLVKRIAWEREGYQTHFCAAKVTEFASVNKKVHVGIICSHHWKSLHVIIPALTEYSLDGETPIYFPSKRTLEWPNGSKATLLNQRSHLVGHRFHCIWAHEFRDIKSLNELSLSPLRHKIPAPEWDRRILFS